MMKPKTAVYTLISMYTRVSTRKKSQVSILASYYCHASTFTAYTTYNKKNPSQKWQQKVKPVWTVLIGHTQSSRAFIQSKRIPRAPSPTPSSGQVGVSTWVAYQFPCIDYYLFPSKSREASKLRRYHTGSRGVKCIPTSTEGGLHVTSIVLCFISFIKQHIQQYSSGTRSSSSSGGRSRRRMNVLYLSQHAYGQSVMRSPTQEKNI